MPDDPNGRGYRVHFVERNARPLLVDASTVRGEDVEAYVTETFSMWEVDLGSPGDRYVTEIVVAARDAADAERKGEEYAEDGDGVVNDPVPRGPPLVESVERLGESGSESDDDG